MSEIEHSMSCENCGSCCRTIFDNVEVRYDPEYCPFCGEMLEISDADGIDMRLDAESEDESDDKDDCRD